MPLPKQISDYINNYTYKYKQVQLWKCEIQRSFNIRLMFKSAKLTERLILSSILFTIFSFNRYGKQKTNRGDSEIRYLYKYDYYTRLIQNDIKNKNTLPQYSPEKYSKFMSWKKKDLIRELIRFEKLLWDRAFEIRKLHDEYGIRPLGMVIFE